MVSEPKTLVVFDTNTLRRTIGGGSTYGSFEFTEGYNNLNKFIEENKLSEFIKIIIPRIVIEELLKQKIEQYEDDTKNILSIVKRLITLPEVAIGEVRLPDSSYDCSSKLNFFLEEFIRANKLNIVDLPDDKLKEIFLKIKQRSIDKKPPFKNSDTGFKDVIIWETILNYLNIKDFHKTILISKDGGFNEKCKIEFEKLIERFLVMTPSPEYAIEELKTDYSFYLENKEIIDFTKTDVFKKYIESIIDKMKTIQIDETEYEITEKIIEDYCDNIETLDEDETGISTIISTKLKINFNQDGVTHKKLIYAKTSLDDTKGIMSTELHDENDEIY